MPVPRWRPLIEVTPLLDTHDEQPYRRAGLGLLSARDRSCPTDCLGDRRSHPARIGMPPRTDGQAWVAASGGEVRVVTQLINKEEVVPAADQAHRYLNGADMAAEVGACPVGITLPVLQHLLVQL